MFNALTSTPKNAFINVLLYTTQFSSFIFTLQVYSHSLPLFSGTKIVLQSTLTVLK